MSRLFNGAVLDGYPTSDSPLGVEIHEERVRAHAKHDSNGMSVERADFDSPRWLSVVVEEIGEIAKVFNEEAHLTDPAVINRVRFKNDLREELIQVMAMCSAWIDAIEMDRP